MNILHLKLNPRCWSALGIALLFLLMHAVYSQQAQSQSNEPPAEWKAVQGAMGRSGELQPDGTFKFSMPRKDLKVTVAGTQVKPGFALGSWTAFKKGGKEAMIMGDLVLTEDEVSPVMQKLEEGGIEITALHNHLLHESPRVMYMHIGGMGDPVKMAQTISAALSLTGTPSGDRGGGQESTQIGIDTSKIEQTLGHKGRVKGGVFQFSIPRAKSTAFQPVESDQVTGGASIPNSMGVAQSINFQPTDSGKAAITGDFVLVAKEVNPVI